MKSNQLTYYTVVSLLARSAGGTNWSTEMFLERHRQCVKPHRSRLELYTHKLNLKSLFNCRQFTARAACSELTTPACSHPMGGKKKAFNEDLAEAFLCQDVVEQFQEMLRAKHLRKDLRLNQKLPEGQQVNKGASVYSAREDPICAELVRSRMSRTTARVSFFFFFCNKLIKLLLRNVAFIIWAPYQRL